jgi:hypothetical protein
MHALNNLQKQTQQKNFTKIKTSKQALELQVSIKLQNRTKNKPLMF